MQALNVAVVLKHSYHPHKGGAFSYYDRLVDAIDSYEFDKRINFSFIYIGEEKIAATSKTLINLNPHEHFTRKERMVGYLRNRITKKSLNFLSKPIHKRYNHYYKQHVLDALLQNNIDLLYYLSPTSEKFNFPYVETHWDNGHLSTFAFPEVSMNNTYAVRENYLDSLKKAFAIFCESDSGKKEFLSFVKINPGRIFVVPLFPGKVVEISVDTKTEQAILHKYGVKAHKCFFYPAQFWSHKNHSNLLIAFKKAKEDYTDIQLLLTGADKGNLEYVKKLITELGLQDSVLLPGFVSIDDLHCFYKNSILVMPTYLGPTNLPLLEAAELGCPVICSDLVGHREQLGGNAYYIQPQDTGSIYSALVEVLRSPPPRKPVKSDIFNLTNALKSIENNFLQLLPVRRTFGNNFAQF